MKLDDFDYPLPRELIAQFPTAERPASRLLHLDGATGALTDHAFRDIVTLLAPGDVMVFNDTRVIKARLDHAGVVEHHHIARREQRDDIPECVIGQRTRCPIEMQQPARRPLRGRKLRDQFARQRVIEIIELQLSNPEQLSQRAT